MVTGSHVQSAYNRIQACDLCPHACGVNRLNQETGRCKVKDQAVVGSFGCHHGEEEPLVGKRGSGTIFFSHCNLRCVFCQNADLAHEGHGQTITDDELANIMLRLEQSGAHNINLVTPTHVVHNIIHAISIAKDQGLSVPIVYNTSGYETIETLGLLQGIVDVYLVDVKFWDSTRAARYTETQAKNYPDIVRAALHEMQAQVGILTVDDHGLAQRGLMVRHLIMPNNASGTRDFLDWMHHHMPLNTYINLMAQYDPAHRAAQYPEIDHPIDTETFIDVVSHALNLGLTGLDKQTLWMYDRCVSRHA